MIEKKVPTAIKQPGLAGENELALKNYPPSLSMTGQN